MTQQAHGLIHEQLVELIPAYAIGAADPGERSMVDAHLPACAECRALLADYQAMSNDLLFATPAASAPVGSGERLRKQLARQQRAPAPRAWTAFLRRPAFALGIAALALLVLTNFYWSGRVGRLEREASQLTAVAQAPGIRLQVSDAKGTYDSSSANGIVYVQPGSNVALLCVYSMPSLEPGKTYQAWLVRDGQRVSAGIFGVNRDGYGVLIINSGKPVTDYQQLGITVEPAGGSTTPTTPRVMGGEL